MDNDAFADALIANAERIDRQLGSARVAELKAIFASFKAMGLSDEDVKSAMALTSHEMRLIRRAK